MKTGCGDASLSVWEYNPPIDDKDWNHYTLQVYHEVRINGGSFVEWRLFAGSSKTVIEGPSREHTLQSTPYYVHMDFDEPDNVLKTNVRFIFAMAPIENTEKRELFSTGTNGDSYRDQKMIRPFAWCDTFVRPWESILNGEGWRREFTCIWPREFDHVFNSVEKCRQPNVNCANIGKV